MIGLKSRLRPSPALAISVAALVIASTGVAVGAMTSADGTISACYANGGGPLHIVDETASCLDGQSRIAWNQRGPAGPAGGLSQAWFAGPKPGQVTMSSRTTYSTLRSLDLPAGSYAIDARSNLRLQDGIENLARDNRGPANVRAAVADCRLRTRPAGNPAAPPGDIEYATAITSTHTRAFDVQGESYSGRAFHTLAYTRRNEVPLALSTIATLSQATTVSLECRVDYGGREGSKNVRPSIVASVPAIRALVVGAVQRVS